MATNTFVTISMVTQRALVVLENSLTFAKNVNRGYDDRFAVDGGKIGDTLNIRKPARFLGREGATLAPEDYTETTTPLVISTQYGVDLSMSCVNKTLDFDDLSRRFIEPAVSRIANKIDQDGMELYKKVWQAVGTPGTVPATTAAMGIYLDAGVKLNNSAAPTEPMWNNVINPRMQASAVAAFSNLFQSSAQLKTQYEKGSMGLALGFDWYMDQNTAVHTVGLQGGSGTMTGSTTTGATQVVTGGWTNTITGLLVEGDIITIDDVYGLNPQSYNSTGELMQFVVTANVNSTGGGAATIPISPAIVSTGAFKNVSALPLANAGITVLGASGVTSPQGLAFHRDAFTLGMADLVKPPEGTLSYQVSSKKLGLSIRAIEAYDVFNDKVVTRLDVLYGWAAQRPELACRICS